MHTADGLYEGVLLMDMSLFEHHTGMKSAELHGLEHLKW